MWLCIHFFQKKKKGLRCSRLMLLKTRESFLQEGTFCVHSPCFVFLLCSLTCMADLQRYPLSWHHFPPESPQPLSSDSSILSRSCRCFIHNTPVNFYVLLICMCMGVWHYVCGYFAYVYVCAPPVFPVPWEARKGSDKKYHADQLTREELNLFPRKMAWVIDGLQSCNACELWLDSSITIGDKIWNQGTKTVWKAELLFSQPMLTSCSIGKTAEGSW